MSAFFIVDRKIEFKDKDGNIFELVLLKKSNSSYKFEAFFNGIMLGKSFTLPGPTMANIYWQSLENARKIKEKKKKT